MGMEKYEFFVRRTPNTLVYDSGWSRDNATGSWRALRPVKDAAKCTGCALCWMFCPEGLISRPGFEIDYAYCKGCGICAQECKVGALVMVREGEAPKAG